MPVPIKMPDLGTTVEECTLISWLVQEGQSIKRGDYLAEIETDKATVELESTAEGVVLKQMVDAGAAVQTGDILAYIGRADEVLSDGAIGEMKEGDRTETVSVVSHTPTPPHSQSLPLRISPVVRNLANKLGVDLARVEGTGHQGVITREDVLRSNREKSAAIVDLPGTKPARPSSITDESGASSVVTDGRPVATLSRAQLAVSRAVQRSWQQIPHLRINASLEMTAAQRLRDQGEASGIILGYDALFLKALALAIKAVPLMGARLEQDKLVYSEGIHLALAIGFENELFLPVVREVERKTLAELQREIIHFAKQARSHALKPEQMTGGCMALSNLGMYPIESFEAIIFPEHSAILAVGAVQKKPVVVGDCLGIRPVAQAQLAADHRFINGRTAAAFLTRLKEVVESGQLD